MKICSHSSYAMSKWFRLNSEEKKLIIISIIIRKIILAQYVSKDQEIIHTVPLDLGACSIFSITFRKRMRKRDQGR